MQRLQNHLASTLSHILHRYQSEIVLTATYMAERYSLAKSDATAAEGIYGMRRSRVVMERGGEANGKASGGKGGGMRMLPLTEWDKIRCAIVAAWVPYLGEKLAAWYQKQLNSSTTMHTIHDGRSSGVSASPSPSPSRLLERIRHKVRTLLVAVYPYLRLTAQGTALAYQFGYLAGLTGYCAPSLHVLGVLVRRITRADLQQQQGVAAQQPPKGGGQQQTPGGRDADAIGGGRGLQAVVGTAPKPASATSTIPGSAVLTTMQSGGRADDIVRAIRTTILVGGSALLVTGWMAHFREELRQRRRRWITGEDDVPTSDPNDLAQRQLGRRDRAVGATGRNRSLWTPQSNPIPPPHPPKLLDESESEYIQKGLPTDPACCPMCHRPRVNPAASTSGHVFCYRCLVMHLRSHEERCPLTGMHCPESRVIRLFEPTAADESRRVDEGSSETVLDDGGQEAGQNTGYK